MSTYGVSMLLVGGQDQVVADWAGQAFGKPFLQPLSAFGITEADGLLKGAVIFNDFQGKNANIEMTYFGPGTISRGIIRALAAYAFIQNNVSRVTCKTRRDNVIARKILPRLGFKFEGVLKRYWGTEKGSDALIFMLDRNSAKRWLGA